MTKKIFLAFLCLSVLSDCTVTQKHKIATVDWLIGTWENKTPQGSIYESWTKVHDTEFLGKSYLLKDHDTIVFETIRLVQESNGLFYIPTVKNQNEGLPVSFALKTITDTSMVFENSEHDFPQTIGYRKIGTDSLIAVISGIRNGQERRQMFPMKMVD